MPHVSTLNLIVVVIVVERLLRRLPKLKINSQAAPVTPLLANRPKRLLKPSLKVRENLGLI